MGNSSTPHDGTPTVFCIPEEAHFEMVKMRDFMRVMSRLVQPGTAAGDYDFVLRPYALSWLITQLWTELDRVIEATYWSADHAVDIEEAHARSAAIRERNEALRSVDTH